MELVSPGEPWTAAVAWARPWRRAPRHQSPARKIPEPAVAQSTGDDWPGALRQLAQARRSRVALAPGADSDVWVEVMADHAVHLALRQVRALADRLELVQGELAGPTGH